MCETDDRHDELYRLLLFYRDRVISSDGEANGNALDRLLVVGEGFDKDHVSEIVNETLETLPRVLNSTDVGLVLPPGELSFDSLAAPAGLATLAW